MSKRSLWILAAAGIALAFGHVRTGHAQSGVDLSGTWVLNKDLSDDPQAMMQKRRQSMRPPGEGGGPGGGGGHGHYGEGRGGGPGGGYGGGQGGGDQDREQIRQRLHNLGAPDRLVIAENDHDIMLIANSADTLDVVPDGKEHARKTPRGLTVTTQAQWNELALQVTTRGEGGREMTRVYRINSDGRLEVVTQLPARDGAEAMQIVLRYDDASAKN